MRKSLAELRELARTKDAVPETIEQAVQAFLRAGQTPFRDPEFTLQLAERSAEQTHRNNPERLYALAEALRASGQPDKARNTALEGLKLLSPVALDTPKSRLRRLLENEMHQ